MLNALYILSLKFISLNKEGYKHRETDYMEKHIEETDTLEI